MSGCQDVRIVHASCRTTLHRRYIGYQWAGRPEPPERLEPAQQKPLIPVRALICRTKAVEHTHLMCLFMYHEAMSVQLLMVHVPLVIRQSTHVGYRRLKKESAAN